MNFVDVIPNVQLPSSPSTSCTLPQDELRYAELSAFLLLYWNEDEPLGDNMSRHLKRQFVIFCGIVLGTLTTPAWVMAQPTTLTEGFDTFTNLAGNGWSFTNNSVMAATAGQWRQGSATATPFNPTPTGAAGSYVRSSFSATSSTAATGGNLSDWMVTPALTISNGTTLSFFTTTTVGNNFPERLQVRLNPTNTTNVGATDQDVGNFTTLLLDINPTHFRSVIRTIRTVGPSLR